jgi:hypothetical protein
MLVTNTLIVAIVTLISNIAAYRVVGREIDDLERTHGPMDAYISVKEYSENFRGPLKHLFLYGAKMRADEFIEEKDEFGPYDKCIEI